MKSPRVKRGEGTAGSEMLERLRALVSHETPSGDRAALRALSDEIVRRLVDLGAAVSWLEHPTGDHAVCRFAGTVGRETEAPLLLLAHVDTVWPLGQRERMPWSVSDGIVRGPGSYDMKGGIVVIEEAIRRTTDASRRPITVLLVADEEVGSPTARALIEEQAAGAQAVLGFEPPHPDGGLKTSRWGSTRLRLTVSGREAHAALDASSGVSAIDELVDQLLGIRGLTAGVDGVLCNVGTITGGTRTNVFPGQASAEIGLRFRDEDVESTILAAIQALSPIRSGAVLEVAMLSNRPAWQPGRVHREFFERLAAVGAAGGQHLEGRPATGAADTNFTGRLGVPSVDGLGPRGKGAHAPTEQIVANSLGERADLLAAILETL
jgi:glutamate carboxypeptidase